MGGFDTLVAGLRKAAADQRAEEQKVPVRCPRCGARLQVRGAVRNCPMGHWRWEGG